MKKEIKIGYEIGTADPVNIKLSHYIITGITQESGKTTCANALIERSGLKAIVFRTKPGENSISGTIIPPYYKEEFNWKYAQELLETNAKTKLKFELSWIIRYAKMSRTLEEFKANIDRVLKGDERIRDLEKSVLITLQAYLEEVIPELRNTPFSSKLTLNPGINIMELGNLKEETQALVIRSVLLEVLANHTEIIVIIPEAWKYLPEKLGSPVKRPAESYIRQGAANRNYLWLDSQDITGVSKLHLKSISTWILGYQREFNEIKRTLDQLTNIKKPKPGDIATLPLGHFLVATKEFTKKVFVQPSWMDSQIAIKIAKGELKVDDIIKPKEETKAELPKLYDLKLPEDKKSQENNKLRSEMNDLRADFNKKTTEIINQVNNTFRLVQEKIQGMHAPAIDEDALIQKIIQKMPAVPLNAHFESSSNAHLNAEDMQKIISEVTKKIPLGDKSVIYQVAPLEMIKKEFLQEAKAELINRISTLDNEQKKMLKWIEQNNKNTTKNEIFLNCFGQSATGGTTYTNLAMKLANLLQLELIKSDTAKRVYPNLKERISARLSQYNASSEEIMQVYNHVLADLLK